MYFTLHTFFQIFVAFGAQSSRRFGMLGEKGGDEMNEWEVVGVIVVLLGLIASISGPMIKLNGTLTRLNTKMEHFTEGLEKFQGRYKDHLKEQGEINTKYQNELDDHEHRITVLEAKERHPHPVCHDADRGARMGVGLLSDRGLLHRSAGAAVPSGGVIGTGHRNHTGGKCSQGGREHL